MPEFVEPLRIVLLADGSDWAGLLREHLRGLGRPFTLHCATNWEAACALSGEAAPSLLLAMPQYLPAPGHCRLPLVLLLEREPQRPPPGGSDWLVREGFCRDMLRRCLRYLAERRRLHDDMRRLAEQDPLTGIANRQGFQGLLARSLPVLHGRQLALGYLDLDNFHHANDTLGHQAGDQLIREVVARLRAQLSPCEHLARLGSDEFALLLETGAGRSLEQLGECLTEALSEPYLVDGESLLLGCSLGLAPTAPALQADALMWHAHIAMQQAKGRQGCTYHVYDERIDRSARSLADLEASLRRALRGNELELHYQPRLSLDSGRIVGVEALVRWRHPQLGLLPPDQFIPLAEQSGLIVPLGYWVMARAMDDMRALREHGLPPLHMAVNLSFRQFQDSQLLPTLERLIESRGVDAGWLEFELTESSVMRRPESVQRTMHELSKIGVRFSLDDFGTGFSSFAHLNRLPITLLKVDRSFVVDLGQRAESRQLVRAMINLAHSLGLQVVVEGVEDGGQLALLRQYGCDQVQGYLISRPLPLEQLQPLLQGQRLLAAGSEP